FSYSRAAEHLLTTEVSQLKVDSFFSLSTCMRHQVWVTRGFLLGVRNDFESVLGVLVLSRVLGCTICCIFPGNISANN
ncbi:hypothetical protein Tco_1451381, partial [Tanacetum coccineum]